MDLSGRTAGSFSSNATVFKSNSSVGSNQQQRFQVGSAPYAQPLQGSPDSTGRQRMLQTKIQEVQLMQLRQMQNQGKTQASPSGLHMSPKSFASPNNFAGAFLPSPSSNSLAGFGSISSLKSVMSQFQKPNNQSAQESQLPPAPPLVSAPKATATPSFSAQRIPSSVSGVSNVVSASQNESHASAHTNSVKRQPTISASPVALEEAEKLLKKCDWVDKTIWVSRQLLGGQAVNGFLRSTATVQRIKKQRVRQTHKTKSSAEGEANKKRGSERKDQNSDEILMKDVMNVRTAKKIKLEFELGIQFCRMLHGTILEILQDIDPSLPFIEPLVSDSHTSKSVALNSSMESQDNDLKVPIGASSGHQAMHRLPGKPVASPRTQLSNSPPGGFLVKSEALSGNQPPVSPLTRQETSSTASAGNPSGSTLRKNRKKKLPPNTEPSVNLPEFDSFGKRLCTKKEHMHRLFECIRYRALRSGDFVAARVSSRDLWILARVMKDYPDSKLPPLDFVRLPETKREQLFKEKVLIKDVEDKQRDSEPMSVARNLILPLPRSFAEASEWAQRYKKGSRVYAMYPHTTALYTATVLDAITYARDDDDIVVVSFDGDEPDAAGSIPECHIPSRFVTSIPRGFAGAQSSSTHSIGTTASGFAKKRRGNSTSTGTTANLANYPPACAPSDQSLNMAGNFDDLNLDDPLQGLDGFDDLEFDLLGDP